MPPDISLEDLFNWSPMGPSQLDRLKVLAHRSSAKHFWIDWTCIPQLGGARMDYINASHDIYSLSPQVVFVPRIKNFERQRWPTLTPGAAADTLGVIGSAAERVFAHRRFDADFKSVARDPERIERLEAALGRWGEERQRKVLEQAASALVAIHALLVGEQITYPTSDYFGRAWTLAERLARFKPNSRSPIPLAEILSAGDALLYAMSAYWRDVDNHSLAYAERPTLAAADLNAAVFFRGIDPYQESAVERWNDMNRLAQLAPEIVGIGSETAALAVICVEWLLHNEAGSSDRTGELAARLLGECIAYVSIAMTAATLHEEASPRGFRKYLFFQAGSLYRSTIEEDMILAIYRSCGLSERETAEEAVGAALEEVFGRGSPEHDEAFPSLDRVLREALQHDELHVHLSSRGTGKRGFAASDFVPMMPLLDPPEEIVAREWSDWLCRSGIIVSWWWSRLDNSMPVDPEDYLDIEQLFGLARSNHRRISVSELFSSTVTVVYKLHRVSDDTWRLVQVSLSRRSGCSGDGMSPFRMGQNLPLRKLLEPDLLRNGSVQQDLIRRWNERAVNRLHETVHESWNQCLLAREVHVVS